jgi:hypothetical protein
LRYSEAKEAKLNIIINELPEEFDCIKLNKKDIINSLFEPVISKTNSIYSNIHKKDPADQDSSFGKFYKINSQNISAFSFHTETGESRKINPAPTFIHHFFIEPKPQNIFSN